MGTFVSFQNDYIEPGIICKDRMYPDITDSRPTATLSTSCNDIESGGNLTHQRGSGMYFPLVFVYLTAGCNAFVTFSNNVVLDRSF